MLLVGIRIPCFENILQQISVFNQMEYFLEVSFCIIFSPTFFKIQCARVYINVMLVENFKASFFISYMNYYVIFIV